MLADLVRRSRTCRRFHQENTVAPETLRELVELARFSPTGGNRQPLKFLVSSDTGANARIYPTLAWAGYLKGWGGPKEGERPSAYIIVLGDTEIAKSFDLDSGIAAQSIMLGATERGLGGCIIGSIQRDRLRQVLALPERYEIVLVLAIGKPKEQVVLEEMRPDGDIKYWRDEEETHHVPKRSLDELILPLPPGLS